jgi:AcrR family transcriptional regulator
VPRAGLSTAAVVDAALRIVDQRGLTGLTLAAVADRTGVAAPSLYKHVGSLGDLRTQLANRLLDELADRLAAAALGRSGDDAVAALMHAYRGYVLEYPNRYAALPADPLHDPALETAGRRLLDIILAVLRAYGLDDSDAIHAIRCLRATVHGFASIEAAGGFGLSEHIDETYDRLIQMFLHTLPNHSRR